MLANNPPHHSTPAQSRLPPRLTTLILIASVGLLDMLLGYEISVLPFYLIPIAYAACCTAEVSGAAVVVLATLMWYLADVGHPYSEPWIIYPNMLTRGAVFACFFASLRRMSVATGAQAAHRHDNLCICRHCHSVRADDDAWMPVRDFLEERVGSHTKEKLCATCARENFLHPDCADRDK